VAKAVGRRSWFGPLTLAAGLVFSLANPTLAEDWDDEWDNGSGELPVEIHGFVEGAGGARVTDNPVMPDDFVLGEARFRLDVSHYRDRASLSFKGDFLSDAVTDETRLDIRQAWLSLQATNWLDLRVARQVLTWGTGDLLFLNDLFPKDFVSFFIGRDDEFLKAPSNSLKFSAYSNPINIDFVWTPIFTPDGYITGERLSFFDPQAGAIVGADSTGQPLEAALPERSLENGEFAVRLHRLVRGYELAAYGYWGFTKRPRAYDPENQAPAFSRLSVGGASIRGNALGGVGNIEGAYYASRDDREGDDPNIPNSEVRGLLGYERELVMNLTLGLQYYLEWTQQYDRLIANSSNPDSEQKEVRDLVTTRLTWRLMQDTLILSLFVYAAIGDGDTHWRPSLTRLWTDAVSISLGGNIMTGPKETFFGQLADDTNAYLRLRYSF
jgi:hypothetical protein